MNSKTYLEAAPILTMRDCKKIRARAYALYDKAMELYEEADALARKALEQTTCSATQLEVACEIVEAGCDKAFRHGDYDWLFNKARAGLREKRLPY